MSDYATYYDILSIPTDADQAAIRKAYLKASLRYHPDKNPGCEEEAKAKFVEIGQAYVVLGDAAKRAAYDRELSAGKYSFRKQQQQTGFEAANGVGTSRRQRTKDDATDDFDFFMSQFDDTVAGMSESELNMAVGAAAVVGSIIGSIMGARAAKGNAFLSSAASMAGSAMASRAASTWVKTVHEDSTKRALERDQRRAAIERGESVEEPTVGETRERLFKDAGRTAQRVAGAAVGGSSARTNGGDRGQFSWQKAAKLACMAANACSEMQSHKNR